LIPSQFVFRFKQTVFVIVISSTNALQSWSSCPHPPSPPSVGSGQLDSLSSTSAYKYTDQAAV